MLQFDVRPIAVLSLIIEHFSCPTDVALLGKPRLLGGRFCDNMLDQWLQDRHASADKACVDFDDAPEESLGGYPWTVCGCEVLHRVGKTDYSDGPVPKGVIS